MFDEAGAGRGNVHMASAVVNGGVRLLRAVR